MACESVVMGVVQIPGCGERYLTEAPMQGQARVERVPGVIRPEMSMSATAEGFVTTSIRTCL